MGHFLFSTFIIEKDFQDIATFINFNLEIWRKKQICHSITKIERVRYIFLSFLVRKLCMSPRYLRDYIIMIIFILPFDLWKV